MILELDDYEVANLRAALGAALGIDDTYNRLPRCPLWSLNTGDWIGQIYYKLPKVEQSPNKDEGQLTMDSLEEHWRKE